MLQGEAHRWADVYTKIETNSRKRIHLLSFWNEKVGWLESHAYTYIHTYILANFIGISLAVSLITGSLLIQANCLEFSAGEWLRNRIFMLLQQRQHYKSRAEHRSSVVVTTTSTAKREAAQINVSF